MLKTFFNLLSHRLMSLTRLEGSKVTLGLTVEGEEGVLVVMSVAPVRGP